MQSQLVPVSELDRVLVCGDGGVAPRELTRCVEAMVPGAEIGFVPARRIGAQHRERVAGASLVVVVGEVHADAVTAVAEHRVPMAVVGVDELERTVTVDALSLRPEVVIRIRPHGRSPRLALASCAVAPVGAGSVRVRGDGDFDARVTSLTVVNHDPFCVANRRVCRFEGADQVGLCWSREQLDADRLVHQGMRLEVTSTHAGQLRVDCDEGRFRAVCTGLTVGPNWQISVATLMSSSVPALD